MSVKSPTAAVVFGAPEPPTEARIAQHGFLPLSFTMSNITPSGPDSASADVSASGPRLAPSTPNLAAG